MQYNLSQKAQRHPQQPDDCQTLKDWARRIAVAFSDDCDASMLRYHGVLGSAVEVDGFPQASMSQLYLVHDELLKVRGEASSSRRPTAKSSPKSSPAAAKPAAAEFGHAQAQDTGPLLTARLLLCLSFQAGFGQLPKLWIAAKGHKKVRQALATEGSKFPMAKLTAEQKGPAEAIVKYWGEQVAREELEVAGDTPDEDPDSGINVAVRALDGLFGSTASNTATTTTQAAPRPQRGSAVPRAPVAVPEIRRSKRARTAKTKTHVALGGGSME